MKHITDIGPYCSACMRPDENGTGLWCYTEADRPDVMRACCALCHHTELFHVRWARKGVERTAATIREDHIKHSGCDETAHYRGI